MTILDERWVDPTSKCNLCKKDRNGAIWSEEHWTMGISGWNFTFCPECENNRRKECDDIVMDCMVSWKKQNEEYWATHPEELERHKRDVEEYRKTLVKKKGWFSKLFTIIFHGKKS